MRLPTLMLLTLTLFAPLASAADTLASLEEPHWGVDKVWDITVLQAEAGKMRALVFRNPLQTSFDLIVYDGDGAEVYNKTGTRGIQTLPALDAGEYRFFVRRNGAFQVAGHALERDNLTNVSATLDGTTDAYVLNPSQYYDVGFTGDVKVEWWDLVRGPEELGTPTNVTATRRGAYVITLTGEPGTPYTITLNPTDAPPAETPGVGLVAMLGLVAFVAVMRGAIHRR